MRTLLILAAMTLAVPAQAQEWWSAETAHFIVKSRSSEADTRKFAEELERYDSGLRILQKIAPMEGNSAANKVTIFRFGDTNDIAVHAGSASSGIAGFYIPRAGLSVAFVPARENRRSGSVVRQDERTQLDGMSVLKHEYVHHFMMQYFPSAYPRWYVEGYAETMATMKFFDDGSFQVGDPPQYRALQVLELPAFRLREMLDDDHELTGLQALQHYGTGWLLSHYLNFNDEGRTKLSEFLAALAKGENSLTAAERILGDLNQLDRKLSAYRRSKFPAIRVQPPNAALPAVAMRRLAADEVALVDYKMKLWRGITKKEAPAIRTGIEAVLARFPDSVEGHLLLAEVAYDAEDYAASSRAAARALELDPKSARGLIYRGRAANELAKAEGADSKKLIAEARNAFLDAMGVDAFDPRPRIGYYRSFVDHGQAPDENALISLESAFDHAGSDSEYRMLLGRQLLSEKRLADARAVIMPVAFQGHSTGEADADEDDPTPKRLLDAIEKGDTEAAIAQIDKFLSADEDEEKDS